MADLDYGGMDAIETNRKDRIQCANTHSEYLEDTPVIVAVYTGSAHLQVYLTEAEALEVCRQLMRARARARRHREQWIPTVQEFRMRSGI